MATPASVEYPPDRPRRRRRPACNARPIVTGRTHHRDGNSAVHLTTAESQVLSFLPTHLTIEAIAERLGRSRSTVKTHVAHIYEKLGATGRMEAVDRAWELGLLAEQGGHQALIASAFVLPRSRPAPPATKRTERSHKGR
jgi:DNA-binding CsgD family transcriptional regulator